MIDVRQYGDPRDPTVVLLHGGPGAQGSIASLARAIADRFHVLEPLQRRGGATPLSVDLHVHDLHDVIKHHEVGSVRLVGHSWGAMLALTYAARHPRHVGRVVLISCGTFDVLSRDAYQQNMQTCGDAHARERLASLLAQLAAEPRAAERDALLSQIGHRSLQMQSVDIDPDTFDRLEGDEQGHRETWADALRLQREGRQPAEFARITAPVTMLHGADDPHPGPLIRDSLQGCISNLTYVEFADCGHVPWLERRARALFLQTLDQVLRET
jgi:pimeloyl-ACP methyl ester carboxylesterase